MIKTVKALKAESVQLLLDAGTDLPYFPQGLDTFGHAPPEPAEPERGLLPVVQVAKFQVMPTDRFP